MTSTSHRRHSAGNPAPTGRALVPALSPRQSLRNRFASLAHRYTRISPTVLRVCIGLIFCWFGVLKFFPGASAAEDFALGAMTELTLGFVPAPVCLILLAVLETGIGLALLTGFLLRWALAAFFLHMAGVFLSLLVLPDAAWHTAAVPTLEGQYVIKNIVLVAACLHIAADELTP
ncbi:DoxX family protein [Streptomyces microflavus]|uniref:DoxX family protein n=1 Tax=Streptomyces microflavus TaxID=1919 RepID=UPI002E34EF30|nr:DoxX family protein [Streptomyces microflavus]WSS32021.1 DoxX family protein [Streptomyces microflavus]WST19432.1 DoxX family protein [Streptomyces microflavus]